jgi:hypothetical protein
VDAPALPRVQEGADEKRTVENRACGAAAKKEAGNGVGRCPQGEAMGEGGVASHVT